MEKTRLSRPDDHARPSDPSGSPLLRLYADKRENLIRFFTARLRSAAEAEDLVQDLYVKIASAEAEAAQEVSAALLYRIANNLMIDRLRSRQRSAARENAWREGSTMEVAGDAVADEPSAERIVAGRQRLAQLAEAVAALPPQPGRAFRLHKLEGLSHAETAAAMGVSKSAVEKHVSAAMKILLKKLR